MNIFQFLNLGEESSIRSNLDTSATRVVVWLDYGRVPFLDLMGIHLLHRYMAQDNTAMFSHVFFRPGLSGSIFRQMWLARARLLSNGYWGRGWIVQEVVLRKVVHIRPGGQFIRWSTWEEAFSPRWTTTFKVLGF
jgi:hypothetical protein